MLLLGYVTSLIITFLVGICVIGVLLNGLPRGAAANHRQSFHFGQVSERQVYKRFVDDQGRYVQDGPDFEVQTRRLRTYDGVNFTKAGAEKLGHYVEHDLRRLLGQYTARRVTGSGSTAAGE